MPQLLPTIIIPAHNEEKNILTTLSALEPSVNDQEFTIIVVCNGCTDNTATLINQSFSEVICLETDQASKALAIRLAETQQPGFPRIYLDADIHLSGEGAKKLIMLARDKLDSIVLPRSKMLLANVSYWVKLYYQYWYQTRFVLNYGYGCGVYVLSQSARSRFGEWPDLIADDGYVRHHFSLNEIHISDSVTVKVKAPKTWWSLIKIKTRSKYGRLEMQKFLENFPTMHNKQGDNVTFKAENRIVRNPIAKLNYICLNFIALIYAKWLFKKKSFIWLRDDSNR